MCKKKICGCGDPTHDFVQIQSDWEQTDISKPDYILNKPTFKTINGETILGTGDIEIETTIIPATYTTLGGVIIDSSTLSISEEGVITVIGGGSGGGNTNIGGSLVDFNLNLTSSTGSGTTIDLSPMFSNYYDIDQIDELFEEIPTFYNSNGVITTDRNVNFSGYRLLFVNANQYRFSTLGTESSFTLREDRGFIKVGTTEFFVNPDSIQIGTTNSINAYVKLFIDNITDSRQVQFQDKDGTIAYLDDIIGYTLPIASSTTLGGVRTNVGSGVTVHPTTGVISANNLYRTDGTLLDNRNVMGDGKYINFYSMASFNLSDRNSIMVDTDGTSFSFNFGGISDNSTARFRTSLLTDNRIFQMPDKSGTFALLDDVSKFATVDSKTTAYTLVDADCGKVLRFTNSANINVTIPDDLTLGFNVTIVQENTGKLTFIASGSANIDNVDSKYTTRGQYASVSICKTQTGTTGQVIVAGDLE